MCLQYMECRLGTNCTVNKCLRYLEIASEIGVSQEWLRERVQLLWYAINEPVLSIE